MVHGEVAKHLSYFAEWLAPPDYLQDIGTILRKSFCLVIRIFNVLKEAIVDLTIVFLAYQVGLNPDFWFSTRWLNKGRSPDIVLSVITLDGQHVNDAVVNNGDIICLPRLFILIDGADLQVIVRGLLDDGQRVWSLFHHAVILILAHFVHTLISVQNV